MSTATKQRHLLAIRYEAAPNYWMGPVKVGTFDYERFLWGGWGPGYMVLTPAQYEVLKEFDTDDAYEFDMAFVKAFPPETCAPKRTDGWMAPDGTIYPCAYMGHTDLAITLRRYLDLEKPDDSLYDTEDILMALGWLRFAQNGLVTYPRDHQLRMTKAQRKTVKALIAGDDDKDWRRYLGIALRDAEEATA